MENKQLSSGLLMLTGFSICVLTFGSLFKFLHLPSGGKILFAGLIAMIICCIWWLFNVKKFPLHDKFVSTKGTKEGRYWHMLYMSVIIMPVAIALTCVGVAMILMQFPGAFEMLMLGAFTVSIDALYAPVLYYLALKDDSKKNASR